MLHADLFDLQALQSIRSQPFINVAGVERISGVVWVFVVPLRIRLLCSSCQRLQELNEVDSVAVVIGGDIFQHVVPNVYIRPPVSRRHMIIDDLVLC